MGAADFWTDRTSVLFTSLWGWSPETWGTIGWTGPRGRSRRTNLLNQLSDPFITVCYVTSNQTYTDPSLKGKIAGFYLVSHEAGDRDEFTHPRHHTRSPAKWRHSLRAIRAFNYLPEYRLDALEYDPMLFERARAVAAMGELVTDPVRLAMLRDTPWIEVEVYGGSGLADGHLADEVVSTGFVKAGPASHDGFVVASGTAAIPRRLYILELSGDTSAFLGRAADGQSIYKIGLSVSPDLRRQHFQKAMPRGAFEWRIWRSSLVTPEDSQFAFEAAVAGEYAMKRLLAEQAEHLNGEFYLATAEQIESAWSLGLASAASFTVEK